MVPYFVCSGQRERDGGRRFGDQQRAIDGADNRLESEFVVLGACLDEKFRSVGQKAEHILTLSRRRSAGRYRQLPRRHDGSDK